MRLLLYYMVHTFINAIKKMFKSWVAIIIVIAIAFGVLVGVIAVVTENFVEKAQEQYGSEANEWHEEDDNEPESPKTAEEMKSIYQNVTLVILGIAVVIVILNVYPGKRSGEDLFMMADINFLLTAPIRPQTILLYKTILKMGLMLISTLYVMGQIPNLVLNLHVPPLCGFYLIGVWLLIMIFSKLSSILVFTMTCGREWAKNIIRKGIPVVILVLGIVVFMVMQRQEVGALDAAKIIFLSQPAMYVPMFGWITGLVNAMFQAQPMEALIYLVLIIIGLIVMVLLIWNIKVDYYEDSITKATNLAERVAASKSGMKNSRKRTKEAKTSEIGKGAGASCFMVNQFYNYKRFAHFGMVSNTMITYIACGVLGSLFLLKIVHINAFDILGAVFMLICYIRNYGNPIARETRMTFIYMIPEPAFQKLGYSILGSSLISAIDLLPAIVIGGIIMKANIPSVIIWYLLIISFDFMISNTGLLVDLLFPTNIPETVKSVFAMFIKMLGVCPVYTIVIIALAVSMPGLMLLGLLLNIGLGMAFLWISSNLLMVGKS